MKTPHLQPGAKTCNSTPDGRREIMLKTCVNDGSFVSIN